MFFFLVKSTLLFLHVFFPIVSVALHAALAAVWAYGIYIQTSPDTIDPNRKNNGPPWYITKNCNVVPDSTIRAYCMQAKSAFAVSIIMMYVFLSPPQTFLFAHSRIKVYLYRIHARQHLLALPHRSTKIKT